MTLLAAARNLRRTVCAALITTALASGTSVAAPITYSIDQVIGQGSVVGTIQTDGAIGTLAGADILAWSLALNGVNANYAISAANSVVQVLGADLTATATDLFFNYSGGDNGYLLFQDGLNSGMHYYCDAVASNECLPGASVVPQRYTDSSAQIVAMTGNQRIASVAVATPEPASVALIGAGLAGSALLRRRRKTR